jgi:EAL domain-containing protein (putative c-di-GMP-specific phosphodiesterase class I)
MYRAKERGRNTFEFYTSQLTAETREKLSLEMDLRQAQAKGELMVYYQPQIELRSGRIAGVEALLRWRHSTRGLVPPDRFIPVAEESGLIGPIGDWVMHQAIAQQQDWMAQGLAPVRMAVNLSGRQILFSNVVESVDRALRACALSEEQIDLEFEVTESTLLESDRCADALRRLSARGISIAIDDFGTGFSSLAHLKHLPIDTLKIAKLFIRQIPSDADDSAIVSTIIAIGHNLRLRVVGEGVETQEQLAFLRTQGCDEVQGFLFSKAINADEMTQLLHRSSAASTAPEAETS